MKIVVQYTKGFRALNAKATKISDGPESGESVVE